MLLAQVVGGAAIASPSTPQATVQTRAVSCNGLNFHPIESATSYTWSDAAIIRNNLPGDGFFVCDVALPHRATVTKVRFTVYDDSDRYGVRYCGLVRRASDPRRIAEGAQDVAGAPETGAAARPRTVRLTATPVSGRAVVDNLKYSYYLQCQFEFDTNSKYLLRLYSGDVTYTISSTNG
jgi:hypothetical protein